MLLNFYRDYYSLSVTIKYILFFFRDVSIDTQDKLFKISFCTLLFVFRDVSIGT